MNEPKRATSLKETKQLFECPIHVNRHRALVLSARLGHLEVVEFLLNSGEGPSSFNPSENHSLSTPLHQAALEGHRAVFKLLVEKGARTDVRDKLWKGSAIDRAVHANRTETIAYLKSIPL
jgi:ankyrin repeat protein